jgi:hypothetical protein
LLLATKGATEVRQDPRGCTKVKIFVKAYREARPVKMKFRPRSKCSECNQEEHAPLIEYPRFFILIGEILLLPQIRDERLFVN